MKKITKTLSVLLLSLIITNAFAATFVVTATMKNGDVISGKTTLNQIIFKSAYGTLNIPSEKITNIEFGIVTDRSKELIVNTELKKLQTLSGDAAKESYNKILAMGSPILAIVKDFIDSDSYQISEETNYSIDKLIDELYDKAGLDYSASLEDVVEFGDINILKGSISLNEIQLQSNYGLLTVKRENINSLELAIVEEAKPGENIFKLKANQHITGNSDGKPWLNTGITVKKGDVLNVTATGKVKLQSLSGGIYSPDGFFGGKSDSVYDPESELPYGSPVYKIGDTGTEQRLTGKNLITAEKDGTIYLSIYETVFDKGNSGFYSVKIIPAVKK